jgi:hypothetical protein
VPGDYKTIAESGAASSAARAAAAAAQAFALGRPLPPPPQKTRHIAGEKSRCTRIINGAACPASNGYATAGRARKYTKKCPDGRLHAWEKYF